MTNIEFNGVFEAVLESVRDYADAFRDVQLRVQFVAPNGEKRVVDAFWDGGRTWRVRFSPTQIGTWRWRSAGGANDAGLDSAGGEFQCLDCPDDDLLLRRGAIKLSADRRSFVHADGTPFFWLADTAWNGVLCARQDDWRKYLQTRRRQKFSVIQFVCTHWRAFEKDAFGEAAFDYSQPARLNPDFFRRLDEKVAEINRFGLVAAPVILWAVGEKEPGLRLSEDDAVRVARYIVARWNAHQVIWILGGDGTYAGELAERWKRVGRAVFGDGHDRLSAMHFGGQKWFAEEFRRERWYHAIGYQSGHGQREHELRWLLQGPPATNWKLDPPLPVINMEPNYEQHPAYGTGERFGAYEVRRAAYWSLLISPAAGVSYGCNSIWCWLEQRGPAPGHANLTDVPAWRDGLELPGANDMTLLRNFFDSLPWPSLRPAPEMLLRQPGEADIREFIACARAGDELAVAYLPRGGDIELNHANLRRPVKASWFNPRDGRWTEASMLAGSAATLSAPDAQDWLLVLRAEK